MTKIRLDEIAELAEVDVREFVRPEAVERYSEILDQLPPISLMRLPDGRQVLTDGKHRVAAAQRIGRKTIAADITDGSIEDAVIAAATANATHGVPFSREEQKRAVLHLWESDGKQAKARTWTRTNIALAVGVGEATVHHWIEAERGRRKLNVAAGGHVAADLSDSHVEALMGVPTDMRPVVAEAATRHKWQRDDIRKIAKALADPAVPDNDKRDVLAAISQPGENGEATLGAEFIAAVLQESRAFSAKPQIRAFVGAAYSLIDHLKRDPDAAKGMSGPDLRKLTGDLDVAQEAVDRLRTLVGAKAAVA